MIEEQDRTMDSISGTLMTLAQQAGLMGQEIGQHNEWVSRVSMIACAGYEHSVTFTWFTECLMT